MGLSLAWTVYDSDLSFVRLAHILMKLSDYIVLIFNCVLRKDSKQVERSVVPQIDNRLLGQPVLTSLPINFCDIMRDHIWND